MTEADEWDEDDCGCQTVPDDAYWRQSPGTPARFKRFFPADLLIIACRLGRDVCDSIGGAFVGISGIIAEDSNWRCRNTELQAEFSRELNSVKTPADIVSD